MESELLEPRALKGLRSLGILRLEGGVGVASGGRLFGLPPPPEITEGVLSFFTLKNKCIY